MPVVELQRSHTDLLFFNFYAGHGDRLQLTAASLLFERGWRFNIPNQVCPYEFLYSSVPLIKFKPVSDLAGKMAWDHSN